MLKIKQREQKLKDIELRPTEFGGRRSEEVLWFCLGFCRVIRRLQGVKQDHRSGPDICPNDIDVTEAQESQIEEESSGGYEDHGICLIFTSVSAGHGLQTTVNTPISLSTTSSRDSYAAIEPSI